MNLKYICIQNDPNKYSRCHYFTPGKIYDVLFVSGNYFSKNDKLQVKQFSECMFNTHRFKMVEVNKWRENQLNEILK
jgi:hypothetical protein